MTLEEYLQQKVNQLAEQIAAQAPIDSCPDCGVCEGHLVYEATSRSFEYECRCCGLRWSPDHVDVDRAGRFQMLELAD